MADQRFFNRSGPFSLAELAAISGGRVVPEGAATIMIGDIAPLDRAGQEDLTFLDNPRYAPALATSEARACVLAEKHQSHAREGMALVVTDTPYRAYAQIAAHFYPTPVPQVHVHPSALVDETAKLGAACHVGPHVVIGPNVEIGDGVRIGANSVIDQGVVIGAGTQVGPSATLMYCIIGARCKLHAGVRIGTRGFGFAMESAEYLDMPQLGRVLIGDDVEVGANSTIDRGAGPDTVIGDGTKIDNLVQIGHNVQTGRGCVLVAQSGFAGSTKLGDFVVVGGQAGLAGHLTIGDGAQIAAMSGVMRDIAPGEKVVGAPARPVREFFRLVAMWQRQLDAKGKKNE